MIKGIQLKSYKRFDDFRLTARKGNILVGPNNSGKSSILDALRLTEIGLKQMKRNPTYIRHGTTGFLGYQIPDSSLPFTIANSVRNYGNGDAEIIITHENGNKAVFLAHPDRSTRFYVQTNSGQPRTAVAYRKSFPIELLVVPTLGPLEINERVRKPETIEKNMGTRIAARNFRNIWKYKPPSDFSVFQKRIADVWPGITIDAPIVEMGTPQYLTMFFNEGRIPREIQWAGFGFQIWLQLQTHLARATENSILVLDEPDIYLHPELQHALYHDVSSQFKQYFIATHATEIINESPTQDLIVIDPMAARGKRIATEEQYVAMLDYIGSAQNADFAKISRAKKVIFVEGKDAKILRMFAKKFGYTKLASSSRTPIQRLGGFTQSSRAKATVWAFKELLGVNVETLCLFDRDYRCEKEVENFKSEMEQGNQKCFVLKRKEIENYLCDCGAISSAVNKRLDKSGRPYSCSISDIRALMEGVFDEMKDECNGQILGDYIRFYAKADKHTDTSTHVKNANKQFNAEWATFEGRLALAPGKDVIKRIMSSIQNEYDVSITVNMIVSEISRDTSNDLTSFLGQAELFMR
ncbi:hypothetical protein GCM10007853_07370 [Algimonas ampicilliniresistens]|uniref:ATPase AAA-type core domain-containing protein n=1 Tax=Algimonas ampicilliniresistens TaxID=1298735 RepID=A0ABQ5V5P0_9PROT|nr:ATP-binding protein [Algimonas ampicilliniresistens]GLQ22863.1 hypothetical protein GCM10007853_07370 [Algimonas ampicilliniresistens]